MRFVILPIQADLSKDSIISEELVRTLWGDIKLLSQHRDRYIVEVFGLQLIVPFRL
jgi:hypothetical protein